MIFKIRVSRIFIFLPHNFSERWLAFVQIDHYNLIGKLDGLGISDT